MPQIQRLKRLKNAQNKSELSGVLGIDPSFLTRTLYINDTEKQYSQFVMKKKTGGTRKISAPNDKLKSIQSSLSDLLLDCTDALNIINKRKANLSHGFARNRSIITNASAHRNQKNVLNLDLKDFFDSFNFGRVRGFFIKNFGFELHKDVATTIAKIACYKNTLPQGSPCSPVIANLITHSLDIRLALLAKKYSCVYSRYADDITFSTRRSTIPVQLVKEITDGYEVGKVLRKEIKRAGFEINPNKTRVQYKDSRQDVTGLVVNEKVSIKSEYWRKTRAMCHSLFMNGAFTVEKDGVIIPGTINHLNGVLSFIDSVDKHNHKIQKPKQYLYSHMQHGLEFSKRLNIREKTYSKFLFYKYFHANELPTILCEGKTDNIYLKSAIKSLASDYKYLAEPAIKDKSYKLLLDFFSYNKKTDYLLDLAGGCSFFLRFVQRYKQDFSRFKGPKNKNPVILLLDNDTGPRALINALVDKVFKEKKGDKNEIKNDIRNNSFTHITDNLYLVLTPLSQGKDTAMEDFFDQKTLNFKVGNKTFNPKNDFDTIDKYGKHIFSTKVIQENKATISFDLFRPVLDRVTAVLEDYSNRIR